MKLPLPEKYRENGDALAFFGDLYSDDYFRQEYCDKHKLPHLNNKVACMRHALALFEQKDKKGKQFLVWHKMMDYFLDGLINEDNLAIAGHSRASKSYFVGIVRFLQWLFDPKATTIYIFSSTLGTIKSRIGKPMVETIDKIYELFPHYKDTINVNSSSNAFNITKKGDRGVGGIFGLSAAVTESEESLKNKSGRHNDKIFLIYEEPQDMSPYLADLIASFDDCEPQVIALLNLDKINSLAGAICEPVEGWEWWSRKAEEIDILGNHILEKENVTFNNKIKRAIRTLEGQKVEPYVFKSKNYGFTVMWCPYTTSSSLCYEKGYHAGYKKYGKSHLSVNTIEQFIRKNYPLESRIRLWYKTKLSAPLPQKYQEGVSVIVSDNDQFKYKVFDDCTFIGNTLKTWGVDPSRGHDAFKIIELTIGQCDDLIFRAEVTQDYTVPIPTGVRDLDLWLVNHLGDYFIDRGIINRQQIIGDATGASESSFWETFSREWNFKTGKNFQLVNCSAKIDQDLNINFNSKIKCKDYYSTAVAMHWLTIWEFAKSDQIRNLPKQASKELRTRKIEIGELPIKIQPKTERKNSPFASLKKELGGKSPDTTDSLSFAFYGARTYLGFHPGDIYGKCKRLRTMLANNAYSSWQNRKYGRDNLYNTEYLMDKNAVAFQGMREQENKTSFKDIWNNIGRRNTQIRNPHLDMVKYLAKFNRNNR